MRKTIFFAVCMLILAQLTGCAQITQLSQYSILPQNIYSSGRKAVQSSDGTTAYTAPRAKSYVVWGKSYQPYSVAYGYSEVGIASWYGEKFHGRKTANGETYNMYGMSAAHKLLPLGTIVRVENLENGRSVQLVVNDRGPFIEGRLIDLSYGAAKALGTVEKGLGKVRVTAVSSPRPKLYKAKNSKRFNPGNGYYVQVGTYSSGQNARKAKDHLLERGFTGARIEVAKKNGRVYHRVRSGLFTQLGSAQKAQKYLKSYYPSCFIAG
ncbi:MAG: septal ring lytic transglycosylase RlpA family protein [Desulfovibrio sp.]